MKVEKNKVVSFTYQLFNDDKELIEEATKDTPATYLHGAEGILPALADVMDGKEKGFDFELSVTPENGFGNYDENLVLKVSKKDFGDNPIEVGMEFALEGEDGDHKIFEIIAIEDEDVTLDGNHPFADENLHFKGSVVEIRDASDEEIAHGHAHHEGHEHHH